MTTKQITIDWAVTGYHKFRIKPEKNEFLRFEREPNNVYDPWAILVKVKDGRIIGRVPANLCKLLIKLKEAKLITSLKCRYTGTCTRSVNPHFHEKFERRYTKDRNGGGVIQSAIYYMECPTKKDN